MKIHKMMKKSKNKAPYTFFIAVYALFAATLFTLGLAAHNNITLFVLSGITVLFALVLLYFKFRA